MLKFNTLWKGKYLSVVSPIQDSYEAIHENDCIGVVPLIKINNNLYACIRKEYNPAYSIKDKTGKKLYYTIITGTVKNKESYEKCMIRELKEEAGIIAKKYNILYERKKIPINKASDVRMTYYIIHIQEFEKEIPKGDGTKNEKLSKSFFININKLSKLITKNNCDFLLLSSYYILKNN